MDGMGGTCASKFIIEMVSNGTFAHIYHPHNEKLLENATVDVIVYRYWKNILLEKKVLHIEIFKYISKSDG